MAESNPYLKQFFATRRNLEVGLVVAGLISGAIIGAAITVLGKIVTGAPPATPSNYLINMTWFALFGAVIGPTVIWTALKRAPLWRTVVEPLLAGLAGAAVGVALGSPLLFLALVPIGIGAAATRLGYVYREKPATHRFTEIGS